MFIYRWDAQDEKWEGEKMETKRDFATERHVIALDVLGLENADQDEEYCSPIGLVSVIQDTPSLVALRCVYAGAHSWATDFLLAISEQWRPDDFLDSLIPADVTGIEEGDDDGEE